MKVTNAHIAAALSGFAFATYSFTIYKMKQSVSIQEEFSDKVLAKDAAAK